MKTKKALFPTNANFDGVRVVWVDFTSPPKGGEIGKALEKRRNALLARKEAGFHHAYLTLPQGAPIVLLHRSDDINAVLGALRTLKGLADAKPEVVFHLQPVKNERAAVLALAKHLGLGPNVVAYNPPL